MWPADISRLVLEYGCENIIPFSHLDAEASRSGQPLNSQPNVPDMLRHIRDRRDDIGAQRSHVPHTPATAGRRHVRCGEPKSRSNLSADTRGRLNQLLYDALQQVPTENNQRFMCCCSCSRGMLRLKISPCNNNKTSKGFLQVVHCQRTASVPSDGTWVSNRDPPR